MIRIRSGATAIVAATVLSTGAFVTAQAPAAGVARHVRSAPIQVGRLVSAPVLDRPGSFAPLKVGSRAVSLFGIVQNHLGVLVPNAGTVYVRELLTGQVVDTTRVNDLAQFSVRGLPPGLYTAELVGPSGSIIASTPAFSAAVGDVIQISQTVSIAPAQGVMRALTSATSSALSSAAASGVMAVTPGAPVSPGS